MTAPDVTADGGTRDEQQRERWRPFAGAAIEVAFVSVGVVAILALAVWLRFADLASNPGGLFADEAAEALDAQRLLHWQGLPPVWFTSDGGREALFAYLVAGMFQIAGQTVYALRATSAALGVAGVVAVGVAGWRFGRGVALAAAAWTAGALWLVAIQRDGMRNGMVPLAGALALIALLAWQSAPSRRRAIVAGAVTSVAALYTYQPLKLLPVLVVVWLLWLRRADEQAYASLRRHFRPFVVAFAIVAVPMAIAALMQPANYFGRVAAVTPFNPEVQADDSIVTHVVRTLGMLTFLGDPNARHDVDGIPLLGPTPIAWLLFGVAAAGVVRLWRRRREPAHALVLLSLAVFMIPPLPAIEGGSPHFLRALGLAVPLAITIGLGLAEIHERIRGATGARRAPAAIVGRAIAPVAGVALLAAVAASTATAYGNRSAAERFYPYSYQVVTIGQMARTGDAVVVDNDSAMVVRFLATGSEPDFYTAAAAISNPSAYRRVLALDRADLERLRERTGTAAPIEGIAPGPNGSPQAWLLRTGNP